MASVNQYVTDTMLLDAIEDTIAYLGAPGAEVVPDVIKDKIFCIISATKRNENLSSCTIGTPSKGGELKFYFNPKEYDEAITILQNAFLIRQAAQEMSTKTDISRQ